MKRLSLLLLLATAAACSGGGGAVQTAQPGHGAVSMQVIPNPIVAHSVGGNVYEFPLEVVVRETGGRSVEVTRVGANVVALGTINVANESYDAARIRSLGFSTSIPPNGELRYSFKPRHEVTDDRLFGGVEVQLIVEAVDDSGAPTTARTTVTVRR